MITLNNKTFLPAYCKVGYSGYTHHHKIAKIPGVDYTGYESFIDAKVPQFVGLIDLAKLDPSLRIKSAATGKYRWKPNYKKLLDLGAAKLNFTEEDYKAAKDLVFSPPKVSAKPTEITGIQPTELIQRFVTCTVGNNTQEVDIDLANTFKTLFQYSGLSLWGKTFVVNNKNAKSYTEPQLETPEISEEMAIKLVKASRNIESCRSGWNYDYASLLEFEDNREMLAKVTEHLAPVPGIKITYLRKRWVGYFSDGGFSLTPDAINHPDSGKIVKYYPEDLYRPLQLIDGTKGSEGSYTMPCIFLGEAWVLHFTVDGTNVLGPNNMVTFVTPEQYVEAYKETRPDLIENFVPWADLIFISSDWCERNGTTNYRKGIDLQTPHQRRMSLLQWIIGPCASRCLRYGIPFKGLQVLNGYDAGDRIGKLQTLVQKYADKVKV